MSRKSTIKQNSWVKEPDGRSSESVKKKSSPNKNNSQENIIENPLYKFNPFQFASSVSKKGTVPSLLQNITNTRVNKFMKNPFKNRVEPEKPKLGQISDHQRSRHLSSSKKSQVQSSMQNITNAQQNNWTSESVRENREPKRNKPTFSHVTSQQVNVNNPLYGAQARQIKIQNALIKGTKHK